MDEKFFYDTVRGLIFGGKISVQQFDGLSAILQEYNRLKLNDFRILAYILATVYHETATTMHPVKEGGRGRGYDYGTKLKMSRGKDGKRIPYENPNFIYYGRGHIQLTWYENYLSMGKLIGVDLLNNPDLMLDTKISIKVLFEGMLKGASRAGDFTGKSLEMYFNDKVTDPINARRVVNGTDKAVLISTYYAKFIKALKLL